MPQDKDSHIFYGWKIVSAIFVLLTFTSGLSFYNHAIYLNALAAQPAFTVGIASMSVSIFFLTGVSLDCLWLGGLRTMTCELS